MTYIQLVKTELTKLRRSHIFWILLAPVILLWIPSFLNADINFEATGISPENNFFIQSYLGFTWFMFPASLVVCTVLLTQSERTNKGLQKMLSLPVNPQLFCLAKFTILLLLAAFQLLLMGAAYFPTAMIVSHMQNYSMVLPVSLVLKESCLLYLSAIPMAALYWMLAVCIHTPVFSIGAGLASIVPSMLLHQHQSLVCLSGILSHLYPDDTPWYYGKQFPQLCYGPHPLDSCIHRYDTCFSRRFLYNLRQI